MRPIDADALLAEYDRVHEGPPGKARTLIENAPTIEPERKMGKWIHATDEGHNFPEHYCSICGAWEYSDIESKFCPNCGADMRGE